MRGIVFAEIRSLKPVLSNRIDMSDSRDGRRESISRTISLGKDWMLIEALLRLGTAFRGIIIVEERGLATGLRGIRGTCECGDNEVGGGVLDRDSTDVDVELEVKDGEDEMVDPDENDGNPEIPG